MKVIIVDDEQPAIDMLRLMLMEDGRVEVAGTYRKPNEAIEAVARLKPDAAFLDVQMPLMSGIDLAERLAAVDGELEVVFVTAYGHYALDAFKVNAVDYLLKPILEADLERSVSRLLKRVKQSDTALKRPSVTIHCLGCFNIATVERDPMIVKWRTAKAEELLAYLLLKEGEDSYKWKMIHDIWGDDVDEATGSNLLHTTIYQIRRTIKQNGLPIRLHFQSGGHYRLELDGASCDYKQFIRFSGEAGEVSEANRAQYVQCLSLYKGELFGDRDYPWSMQRRAEYQRRYELLSKRLCAYDLNAGNYAEAEKRIHQLLELQPFDEEAHELLLRAYVLRNNRIGFIKHYKQLEQLLQSELGIQPGKSIRQLFEQTTFLTPDQG